MDEDLDLKVMQLKQSAGDPGGEAAILAALVDDAPAMREAGLALAARHLSAPALAALVRQEHNVRLCNSALSALERQGPCAVPHLVALTRDPEIRVAIFAVQILGRIREPSAKPALLALLAHDDLNVLAGAIEALGNLRAVDAVPALLPFLRGEMWVQFAAIGALGDIGDESATSALAALVDDDMLGTAAVEALGKIASRSVLPRLLELVIEVDRLPIRDTALGAVAAIIERHAPRMTRFGRLRRALRTRSGVVDFLQESLTGPNLELARAATRLVLAARLRRLYPAMLARANVQGDLSWLLPLCRQARAALASALPALLGHGDPDVRVATLRCCAFDDAERLLLVTRLGDGEVAVREAACWALGQLGVATAVPELAAMMAKGEVSERQAAAEALRQMQGADVSPLAPCLAADMGIVTTLLVLSVLEAHGSSRFTTRVLELAASDQAPVRAAALRALAADPTVEAERLLLAALHDRAPAVGVEAIDLLAQQGARVALPHLIAQLGVPGPLRYHAIRAIGRLGGDEAVYALVSLYPVAATHERIEVVVCLARLGGVRALDFLRERLSDVELDVRRAAVEGLARHGDQGEIDVLVQLATDDDWSVRNSAAWGLGRLGGARASEALLVLARDIETVVARTARGALGRLERRGAA